MSVTAKPDSIYSLCKSQGVTDNDYLVCGVSQINLAEYNSTYNLKPNTTSTPKDTVCAYSLTYKSKFNDTFTVSRDSSTELVIKQTSDGVTTTITPTRILTGSRNLATVTGSYAVTNADSLSIYYAATSDIPTSYFSLTSKNNYYTGVSSSPSSSSTTSTSDNSSSSSSVVAIVVSLILGIVLVLTA